MIDQYGRNITYLRLSVTERCTLRCTYCRVEEGFCPKAEELSAGEFERIVRAFVSLEISKVRITGGEPLLRRDILDIVHRIAGIPGIREISMTTNAQQLPGKAAGLKQAGLNRLNISLDSLNPQTFHAMTGGELGLVLRGIDEVIEAGLLPVKVNMVVVKGVNDGEVDDFIALTRDKPIDVRFIELMPIGDLGQNNSRQVSNDDLIKARPYLKPVPARYAGQPSRDYQVEGFRGRVGFISPISHKFCADCNRIRLMSDGKLRPCLGVDSEVSLVEALKQEDETLLETIRQAIYIKPVGHEFETCSYSDRNMSRIGG